MKEVDKDYCINSFLQFRFVFNQDKIFAKNIIPNYIKPHPSVKIKNYHDIDRFIQKYFKEKVDEKTVLMLSSGMDSALLASYMPKGGMTFTLKCIADNPTIDETEIAKNVAKLNGLKNEIIEVKWEDYEKYIPILLEHKKAPFHSIEVQIYKAALRAKELGYNKLLFGESADCVFGGLDGLLSKDWTFEEFIERYNYVPTKKVLNNYSLVLEPYEKCQTSKGIDAYKFISTFLYEEAVNSYTNSCETAGCSFLSPFKEMKLGVPLNLNKIRNGESKYLIRELFKEKYPNLPMNKKIPMPRPMDLWLKKWDGPKRKEFKNKSIAELNGDAKWLVYILEYFLNYYQID